MIQNGTNLLAAALDPSDQDFLDEGPEDECPEGDRGVAATVVQEERVADLEEVKDGDEEADVVHHGVGHRPVYSVRHGLREGCSEVRANPIYPPTLEPMKIFNTCACFAQE